MITDNSSTKQRYKCYYTCIASASYIMIYIYINCSSQFAADLKNATFPDISREGEGATEHKKVTSCTTFYNELC